MSVCLCWSVFVYENDFKIKRFKAVAMFSVRSCFLRKGLDRVRFDVFSPTLCSKFLFSDESRFMQILVDEELSSRRDRDRPASSRPVSAITFHGRTTSWTGHLLPSSNTSSLAMTSNYGFRRRCRPRYQNSSGQSGRARQYRSRCRTSYSWSTSRVSWKQLSSKAHHDECPVLRRRTWTARLTTII